MNILCHFDGLEYGTGHDSVVMPCSDERFVPVPWLPEGFPSPFRYVPCGAVRKAADCLMERIDGSQELSRMFSEGKMLGVLVVEDMEGRTGFVSGFSGNVGGRSSIDGFVPPIYDLLDPDGHYKVCEREISRIGEQISALQNGEDLALIIEQIRHCAEQARTEIDAMKASMAESRRRRDKIRREISNSQASGQNPEESIPCHSELNPKESNLPSLLIQESQHEKASLRRLKKQWDERISSLEQKQEAITGLIAELKAKRRAMSDELQKWIFQKYIVHNAKGDASDIWDIFAQRGLVPPGGTGECAAPKMLEYAYRHNLKPLAMGEFWYGESPCTAVRVQGHFYPSCTSKCGPLLGFMMRGLAVQEMKMQREAYEADILYIDDEIIVACKPSGMPSVPGLDGRKSLQEWLSDETGSEVNAVHRLDMDTSGVMVFARNASAQADLRTQFEERKVSKTYIARLCPLDFRSTVATPFPGSENQMSSTSEGTISLPLSPDYDERPRQKVDMTGGKEAITSYHIIKEYPDGTADVEFRPLTGRTHQLRVHSAHPLGLGRPIVGDLLYGSPSEKRLHLHAQSITFRHPANGKTMTFSSSRLSF